MTNQQGAPEAPKVRTADYEAGWKDGYKQGAWAAQQPAKAESLRQILTDPENQPNQYGVEFGMSGQQMHFKIGYQLFRLAYEPDDQQEFEFMKRMLIRAFSTFTPDVKMAQHPTTHVQNPAEIEHVAGDVSKNGPESNMSQQPAFTEAQIASACLSYRHDFGLLSETDRKSMMWIARQWERAFAKERELVPPPQPSPTPQADSQPAPEYVGNGMFKGETIKKAAGHWANWCDVRCMTGLSEFLRVVAARAPADSVTAPAGGVSEYTPMLDDEGRAMVGTSHHYTADNIRALVAEYKALEAGGPDTWELHCNTDHRARAGVLWRVISALADEVPFAPPAQAADSVLEDAARLDWLDQQCEAYGFQDIHEGNRWEISGAYANVRKAIDAERAARKQGANHD